MKNQVEEESQEEEELKLKEEEKLLRVEVVEGWKYQEEEEDRWNQVQEVKEHLNFRNHMSW